MRRSSTRGVVCLMIDPVEDTDMLDLAIQWACLPCADRPSDVDLERWATAALLAVRAARGEPLDDGPSLELTIRVVDAEEGRQLNAAFRGQDRPTNVLSFPWEPPSEAAVDLFPVLGDLVLCAPVVAAEAVSQCKPPAHHWAHLTVHGVLHLCGYDHLDPAEAAVMEALERQVLAVLGIPDPYVEHDGAATA